jgi:hypothetical protein
MTTVFFTFVAVVVFVGRLTVESAHVEAAARSAARTISLARNPHAAVAGAKLDASEMVGEGGPLCDAPMGFVATITPEQVTVEVTCTVDLSQAVLAAVPGTMPVSSSATEVIDQFRESEP